MKRFREMKSGKMVFSLVAILGVTMVTGCLRHPQVTVRNQASERLTERRDKEVAEKEGLMLLFGLADLRLFDEAELAMKAKEWDVAEAALHEIGKRDATLKPAAAAFRVSLLVRKGDVKAALALARQIRESEKEAYLLDAVATGLIWTDSPDADATTLAYEIAAKANAGVLEGGCRAGHLYTLARATFMKGDKAKAVELMQKALGFAEDASDKKAIQDALDSYRVGKLPTIAELEGNPVWT